MTHQHQLFTDSIQFPSTVPRPCQPTWHRQSNRAAVIANYGGGVDSTAMLVAMVAIGARPDKIIFADTRSEKPETIDYVHFFSRWLVACGFPQITVVARKKSRPSKTGPGYDSLEGNCLQNSTVPSLAFGRKACSLKWKAEVMDTHHRHCTARELRQWYDAKPIKLIGYDAGPKDSRRAVDRNDDANFRYQYPLREWGWDRRHCVLAITAAGLPVPIKSACFFCPATQPWELLWLAIQHPDLFLRAIAMEDLARPSFTTIEGLWRRSTKTKPGSWRSWAEREQIIDGTPPSIISSRERLLQKLSQSMPRDVAGTSQLSLLTTCI